MENPFQNEVTAYRKPKFPVHPWILSRWSPRAMTGEALSDAELFSLFEAARWAPSSYNNQPWRFLYGKRETPQWDFFFNLMIDFNKGWTKNAGALVLALSKTHFEHNGKPCRTHSFDTGAAWMSMALEGASQGLVIHGMEGFDYDRARKDLNIPEEYAIEALIAIGKRAPPQTLPQDLLEKEKPSPRKEIQEFVSEGKFQGK